MTPESVLAAMPPEKRERVLWWERYEGALLIDLCFWVLIVLVCWIAT